MPPPQKGQPYHSPTQLLVDFPYCNLEFVFGFIWEQGSWGAEVL
jgi:hypothetical protein